jgi:hypothetical protein
MMRPPKKKRYTKSAMQELYSEKETPISLKGSPLIRMDSAIALGDVHLITISISDFNELAKVLSKTE